MAAYNYYGQNFGGQYGAGYFPQNYQGQPMMQQPQIQVPQVQMPQSQAVQNPSPSGIIWVNGLSDAQMFPVGPNNAVALWETSGKTIYLKQADATGKPTIRVYDLVERTETSSGVSQHDEKAPNYVTKDELGTIVEAVKGLASEVDTMKGDLYGMAGRKKTVKKAEEVEDDA